MLHEKDDFDTLNKEQLSPKQAFTVTKGRFGNEYNNARSRKMSLEQAEVATVISGGFNEYTGGRPTARESKDFDNLPRNPLIFLDPVTGQRKCEYRCYNLFTQRLSNLDDMIDGKEGYGFLYCPNPKCA